MIIFPAVDIQQGKAVRLRKGKKEDITVFSDNPVEMASFWKDQGATWLHIVDLDGAFNGSLTNIAIIEKICASTGMPIQIGGGIRSLEAARTYLNAGVKRIIIGTMAIEEPDKFADLCHLFPESIAVSLDAANGKLQTHGWVKESNKTILEVIPELENAGASVIIYTDIERDGMRSGVNLPALDTLLKNTRLPVIAAGGVADMKDVEALYDLGKNRNLEGMITGRAIYEKKLDLKKAINWLRIKEESDSQQFIKA